MKSECVKFQQLLNFHDDFNLHEKLKDIIGLYKRKKIGEMGNDGNERQRDNRKSRQSKKTAEDT